MLSSELRALLEVLEKEHGDLPVYLGDLANGSPYVLKIDNVDFQESCRIWRSQVPSGIVIV